MVSNMSFATFYSSTLRFNWENLKFTKSFYLLFCFAQFVFVLILNSEVLPDFSVKSTEKWPSFENWFLLKCQFLRISLMNLKKLEQVLKEEGLRISKVSIICESISSTSGTSQMKMAEFVSKFLLFLKTNFQKVPNSTWKCQNYKKSLPPP